MNAVIRLGGRKNGKNSFVLSIDPGKNIGVALWNYQGQLLMNQVMDFDTLDDFLQHTEDIREIVYENYITDHRAAKLKGSKNDASQVIGMLKSHARRRNIDIVSQPNNILRIAAMHAGVKIPAKGHIKDQLSAYLHGFYYFETIGFTAPELRKKNELGVG